MVQDGFQSSRESPVKVITQEPYIIGGGHIGGKVWHLYKKRIELGSVTDVYGVPVTSLSLLRVPSTLYVQTCNHTAGPGGRR